MQVDRALLKRALYVAGGLLGIWLAIRDLLPVVLPFLLGGLLALAAEPLVRLADQKLPRSFSAVVGVLGMLVLLAGTVVLLGSFLFKELTVLTHQLPDVQSAAKQGIEQIHGWLDQAVNSAPESVRGLLCQTVDSSLKDSTAIMEQVTGKIPGAVTGVLGGIPKGALTVFTGILSAFLISARLPKIKERLRRKLPESWHEKYLPALIHIRVGLWGWLKAQLKLMLITWGIVGLGLLVLGVDYGILWAGLIALVDAVPVLGTGTILIPWALISFFRGRGVFGIGLVGIYVIALITRTVLEPRMVGRQLGLDPLVTLIAFYAGYTLWGFWGMLLAPVLAAATATALKKNTI